LPGQVHTIDVTARTFAYNPGIIQVHRGDTVTLKLESEDTVHGLALDGYAVDLQAEPGKSSEVTFVADREGTYKFRCSVTCGVLHPFMIGELEVTPDLPFGRALVALSIAVAGALVYFWK
jgi:cytochrome c oxidase subunit 2